MEYALGIIVGILGCIIFMLIFGKLVYKKQYRDKANIFNEKKIYDERQLMARGRAYKGGFISLIISLLFMEIANEAIKDVNLMGYSGVLICITISVTVFAVICIVNDAYISLYESAKKVVVMFIVIGGFNLAIGISEYVSAGGFVVKDEKAVVQDKLSDCVSSMLVGLALIAICVVFLAKIAHDKKVAGEEEFEEE